MNYPAVGGASSHSAPDVRGRVVCEVLSHRAATYNACREVGPEAHGRRTIVTLQTSGRCRLCGKRFTRSGMQRHVCACRREAGGAEAADTLLLALQDR